MLFAKFSGSLVDAGHSVTIPDPTLSPVDYEGEPARRGWPAGPTGR
jgi:hypothetical protein